MVDAQTLTLKALEWDKVKEMLKSLCLTPMGKERVDFLRPSAELEIINRRLQETEEALELLRFSPPLRETIDIQPFIQRAEKEGILNEEELLKLRDFAIVSQQVKAFVLQHQENAPLLARSAKGIPDLTSLIGMITSAISEDGRLKDSASPKLKEIRENIIATTKNIQDKLNEMVNSPALQRYLQEPIVTIREGRFCLAVKREFRDKIEGVVHSTSGSGATLFIEPLAVLEQGNRLRELEREEEEERLKILRKLSKQVKEKAQILQRVRDKIALFDFSFAKGRLALRLQAYRPHLNREGILRLKNARHPLLNPRIAVPVSLELTPEKRVLIITGPNTGGKTTTLKMVGLLSYMSQCGLFIPADEESTLPAFETILADIGDEQSIEQSLSTFSSHITQLKRILENLNGLSLVLLDELGAGTDPAEGAALARAIVEYLAEKENTRLLIATHLAELKLLPFANPHIRGASFEFDPISLQPTFNLVMDAIGKSHAIEVAQRLGLNEKLIRRANELLSHSNPYSELLVSIERERQALREEREKIKELQRQYEMRLKQLEKEREEILRTAREKASELLKEVEDKVGEILKAKSAKKKKRAEWQKLWEQVKGTEVPQLKVGERVLIGTLKREGTVLDIKGERVIVDVEGIRMQIPPSELTPLPSERKETFEPPLPPAKTIIAREVNLRGMTVDEALYELDKELNRASLEGTGKLRIVHGKGKGILRRAIWEYLKSHPLVKEIRLGEVWEGSYGATIVELK